MKITSAICKKTIDDFIAASEPSIIDAGFVYDQKFWDFLDDNMC